VYAGTQALLVRDLAEQPIQLLFLVAIESAASSVIVFARNAPNLFNCVPAERREVQRVCAPVRRVLTPFDQATFLEFIQKRNELAGQDSQPAAKLLLAEPRGCPDQPENTRVRTEQAQAFQSFTKLTRSVRSYLRQQKRGAPPKLWLCRGFGLFRHS
jgi:hypothetical protein